MTPLHQGLLDPLNEIRGFHLIRAAEIIIHIEITINKFLKSSSASDTDLRSSYVATAGDGLFPNRHPAICQGLIHVIALLPYEPEPKVVSVRFTNYCDCDLFSLRKRIMTP